MNMFSGFPHLLCVPVSTIKNKTGVLADFDAWLKQFNQEDYQIIVVSTWYGPLTPNCGQLDPNNDHLCLIGFKKKNDALMFKLTWT